MTPVLPWLVDHADDIAGGVALWLAVAIPVALILGRALRRRDERSER